MKYTPAQFRDAVGISQETLRHWRRVLPVFQDLSGYAPVFSIGDLVTGSVIKCLRTKLGANVGTFANISGALGRALNSSPWVRMQQSVLVLDMEKHSCTLHSTPTKIDNDSLQITIPLQPILAELSAALVQPDNDQRSIYFPPKDVSKPSRRQAGKS